MVMVTDPCYPIVFKYCLLNHQLATLLISFAVFSYMLQCMRRAVGVLTVRALQEQANLLYRIMCTDCLVQTIPTIWRNSAPLYNFVLVCTKNVLCKIKPLCQSCGMIIPSIMSIFGVNKKETAIPTGSI